MRYISLIVFVFLELVAAFFGTAVVTHLYAILIVPAIVLISGIILSLRDVKGDYKETAWFLLYGSGISIFLCLVAIIAGANIQC